MREAPAKTRMSSIERRRVILSSAAGLFGRRGYDATTLEQVSLAAGVTKPVLYRHFGSKQDLYLALLAKHRADLPGFLELGADLPERRLRAILEVWFAYAQRNLHGWQMLFLDTGGGPEIEEFRGQVQARAREVIEGLIETTGVGIPAEQVTPTAELIRAGLAGLILWWIDHPDAARSDLVDAAERLFSPTLGHSMRRLPGASRGQE